MRAMGERAIELISMVRSSARDLPPIASTLSLIQLRRNPRTIKLPNCSIPHSLSPSPLIRSVSPLSVANMKWKRVPPGIRPAASAADAPDSCPPPQQQNPRPGPSSKSPTSPPLWKMSLFASKRVRSIILLNVLAVIYASNIAIVKEVETIMDPAVFTVVRFALSVIPFIPFVLKACRDSQTCVAGIELGFWVSLGFLTQALGLLTSDAGRASFISAFTVIVVPLIDGIFGAAVPAHTWIGAFVSLIGVGMLECSGSPPCVGDILNLLSAICFGIHMLRTEHIARSTKKENYMALVGYQVCIIALLSTVWFCCRGIFSDGHHLSFRSWTWRMFYDWMVSFPWIPALYTGVFSTSLSLWAELAAMRDVSASEAAIIYGLEPVWGAAFAWFLLGERWGTTGWIGAALILCGSLTVQFVGSFSKKAKGIQAR